MLTSGGERGDVEPEAVSFVLYRCLRQACVTSCVGTIARLSWYWVI